MRRAALAIFLLLGAALQAVPAVLFQSAPGRFEIAAVDAAAAQPALAAAQSLWAALSEPLALPEAFSSPIFVRVVPPGEWSEAEPFRVNVEPAGLVSLRLRGGDTAEVLRRRGLVQALLMRVAVAQHGVSPSLMAPLWLEFACVEWWRASESGSRLDFLKQQSAKASPPPLARLLAWSRGEPEPVENAWGAYWLMVFLQAESNRGAEWRRFLAALGGGAKPLGALTENFPDRFTGAAERELWWETGWHHHRRVRTLPLLSAAESRAAIADATRFVAMRDGVEVVVPSDAWGEWGRSLTGRAMLRAAATRLAQQAAALHPFYRNAAISLGRLLTLAGDPSGVRSAEEVAAARQAFDRDWQDASDLEAESARALDALERR